MFAVPSVIPDPPPAVTVYELADPDATAAPAMLGDIARRLGLTGDPRPHPGPPSWASHVEEPFHLLRHNASGGLRLRHRSKYLKAVAPEVDFEDSEAVAVARRFLHRLDVVNSKETSVRAVTHLSVGGFDVDSGPIPVRVVDVGVVFGRAIDGIPVDGQGGFALLQVDGTGEVVGVSAIWRPLARPVEDIPTWNAELSVLTLERLAKAVRGDVVVTRASFAYFEAGIAVRQRFLQPAFIMVYEVHDGPVVTKSALVLPAAQKTLEPFQGGKRFGTVKSPE